MTRFIRVLLTCSALALLAGCVGVIPVPVQTGTTTVKPDDATPPGPEGMEGDY